MNIRVTISCRYCIAFEVMLLDSSWFISYVIYLFIAIPDYKNTMIENKASLKMWMDM